jgi:hypothetical protein
MKEDSLQEGKAGPHQSELQGTAGILAGTGASTLVNQKNNVSLHSIQLIRAQPLSLFSFSLLFLQLAFL